MRRAVVAIAALAAGCAARSDRPQRPDGHGIETSAIDRHADPCVDFYAFANGAWRTSHPIPAGLPRWSRRLAAHDDNPRQLQALLEEASRSSLSGGAQVAGDHYAACMDEGAVETAGFAPLASLWAELSAVHDLAGVQHAIAELHALGIAAPFGMVGAFDQHDPTRFVAHLVAGELGLPRDGYAGSSARAVEERSRYRAYIAELLTLAGVTDSSAADTILALESSLAAASLSIEAAADPSGTYHPTRFAQLHEQVPTFDWEGYFAAARIPRHDLNVDEPKLVARIGELWASTPVASWTLYLQWRLLSVAAPWLSHAYADRAAQFAAYLSGSENPTRAERCLDSTNTLFGDAIGQLYVARYFPPAAKAKAQELAQSLLREVTLAVIAADWMAPDTKKIALQKLSATHLQLGYPDRWKDYSALGVRRDSYAANVLAGRRFAVADNVRQIGRPTDANSWQLNASSPDAYIDLQLNELVLPAGFLQPPNFDPAANDAVNYGALGIGLAHDLTHAIDAGGGQIDLQGRDQRWWSDGDAQQFAARASCLATDLEGSFVAPGVHLDGKRMLSEAVGDLAGERLAWAALQKSLRCRPVAAVDGFSAEQQFFLSWGQFRGDAMTAQAERKLAQVDIHPTPHFRVDSPLSNAPEFQAAFSCRPGAAMVKPPERRCAVW